MAEPGRGGPHDPVAAVERRDVWVDGVALAVVTATPEQVDDPAPLVVTLGILARLDDFEVQRFALLADLLGRPVVAVDTPGWVIGRGSLSGRVRRELRARDFTGLAALMADALVRAGPSLVTGELSVLGYSLGASTGSALAVELAARGAVVRAVDLVEPVAVRSQTMAELTWRNLADARHSGRYLAGNTDLEWAAGGRGDRVLINPVDIGLFAWAISRGGIRASLEELPMAVPIMIISGERSSLSPRRAVHRLAHQLAVPGRTVSVHVVPDAHHALWNSLTHVADIAGLLR